MCSIFKYNNCVGRNFDYEISYNEKLRFINKNEFNNKYKIMGICTGIVEEYPLLYDGINEHGLVCGGLSFEGNAVYNNEMDLVHNIPSYSFVLSVLGNCKSVEEVKNYLENVNITNEQYSDVFPSSDLHWFISDKDESIVVEQTIKGLNIYNGSVMTNNPTYPDMLAYKIFNNNKIGGYLYELPKEYHSRGFETFNLSGDYTSIGRFCRLSYLKNKLEESDNEFNNVNCAFHLLSSIEQIYGVTNVGNEYEYSIYSIVYDMDELKVYLKPYDGSLITKMLK